MFTKKKTIKQLALEINKTIEDIAKKRSLLSGSTQSKPTEYYLEKKYFNFIKIFDKYKI